MRKMKPIDEVLAVEEAKWRGKPYKEIEGILGEVQFYEVTIGTTTYGIEIHTKRGKKPNDNNCDGRVFEILYWESQVFYKF